MTGERPRWEVQAPLRGARLQTLVEVRRARTEMSLGSHHTRDELVDLVGNLVGYLER
jgi:hypothetical protein